MLVTIKSAKATGNTSVFASIKHSVVEAANVVVDSYAIRDMELKLERLNAQKVRQAAYDAALAAYNAKA